jgi:hypothetical protein
MPHRVVSMMIAGACGALGFGAAYFVPRPAPPPRILTRVVTREPAPIPSCMCRAPAPATTSAPMTPRGRTLPPTFIGEPPPATTSGPSPRASALAAFRFSGLGPSGGLRLARVRAGTLPEALGLRSGDELLSINGFKISDPEQALTAYARLRTADTLRLSIQRGGVPSELLYVIR